MKGVFVVGASGAGKTTLTNVLATSYKQFFGGQDVITVNLDCANPYATSDIDICDLISLDDVMEEFELGFVCLNLGLMELSFSLLIFWTKMSPGYSTKSGSNVRRKTRLTTCQLS